MWGPRNVQADTAFADLSFPVCKLKKPELPYVFEFLLRSSADSKTLHRKLPRGLSNHPSHPLVTKSAGPARKEDVCVFPVFYWRVVSRVDGPMKSFHVLGTHCGQSLSHAAGIAEEPPEL